MHFSTHFNALYFFSKSVRTLTQFIFEMNVRNNYDQNVPSNVCLSLVSLLGL